jgi:hypothetical protein
MTEFQKKMKNDFIPRIHKMIEKEEGCQVRILKDIDSYEKSKYNLKTFWGRFLDFIFPYHNSDVEKIINMGKEQLENSKNFARHYQERINEYEKFFLNEK